MKISIGSDHRGVEARLNLIGQLQNSGVEVNDCGTHSEESCDYPDIAETVAVNVAAGLSDRGILICGTGIGMSIAANKVDGIRAVVCRDHNDAEMSRRHNNANVLCLSTEQAEVDYGLVKIWLETEFDGGRHQRRIDKIASMEARKTVS